MKFLICLFFLLIIFTDIQCEKPEKNDNAISAPKTWCWTKSMVNEPNFILNPTLGGMNWGFCQLEKPRVKVKYIIDVITSGLAKSETSSQIKIQLYGDKGKSEEVLLSNGGLERGSEKTLDIVAKDVGKVAKIALHVIGNQGYRCKNITVKRDNKSTKFDCLNRIEPCKTGGDPKSCIILLEADGDIPYSITVKTSDDPDAGYKNPVFVKIKGTLLETRTKILTETGLKGGSSNTYTVFTDDVGDVTGFTFELGGPGKWKPVFVAIKNDISGVSQTFELVNNPILISPGQGKFSFDLNEKIAEKEPSSSNELDALAGIGEAKDSEVIDFHDPNGGLLESKDKKNIIELSCDQKLVNPSADEIIFGPDYPTRNINYMKVLAFCPGDCHKRPGTVFGVGIHPDQTPICLAALVDNAISLYGGIISISIFPGMDQYTVPTGFPQKKDLITIMPLKTKSIQKSYVLAKVDNVDLVDKDMRILDYQGTLSSEGRVEFRLQGKWGSICSLGNDNASARVICKNMGYISGEWKSPNDEKARDFCRRYKGYDYCGAESARIHFEQISCGANDSDFNNCNKLLANYKLCTHSYDAIINCFNEIYEKNTPVPTGVIRLEAVNNDASSTIGRLEMHKQQDFFPVCDVGFNEEAANVACKTMGYISGEIVNDLTVVNNFKLQISDQKNFAASKVECKGKEKSLKECKYIMKDIQCKHDQDLILKCNGVGDPTGKSQYILNPITSKPQLGKLALPKHIISCDTRAKSQIFRGDPGSVFIVQCPNSCGIDKGDLSGTGIYAADSNICLAAIHAGVLDDSTGGSFALVKLFGQEKYDKTQRNNVLSSQLNLNWESSFSVSELNSGWINMNKLFEEGKAISSFIAIKNEYKLKPIMRSFLQTHFKTHFLAKVASTTITTNKIKQGLLEPIFKFTEPSPSFIFSNNHSFSITEHNISQMTKYSFLTKFKMIKFPGNKQFIFSYSGCGGFNIVINKSGELILGDNCDVKQKVVTKIIIPLNEVISLYITYENESIGIVVNSLRLGEIRRKLPGKAMIVPKKEIGIGRMGISDVDHFYGEINYILLFNAIIEEKLIESYIDNIKTGNQNAEKQNKTLDQRDCVTPCLTTKPGDGSPPKEALLDTETEGDSIPKENISNSSIVFIETKGSKPTPNSEYGTYDKSQQNNQESIEIDCLTNLKDTRFRGNVGKTFRVKCPSCNQVKAPIFGTAIYHPLSSICKSAYHSGYLNASGSVLLEITGEHKIFNGSKGADGNLSANFASSDVSFKLKSAEALKAIDCITTASEDIFQLGLTNTKFVVVCPKDCSKVKKEVYGTEIYTDFSPICRAAIHYGILNDKGGEVEFIVKGEQPNFKPSKGFGIISKAKDAFIRSFKFLGPKSAISYKFKEEYKGQVTKLWKVEQDPSAKDTDKDYWDYKSEVVKKDNQKFERVNSISHSGSVRVNSENGFASTILLKDVEFANGIINFNLKLIDRSPIGVVFRYVDRDNYYFILINLKNKMNNLKLMGKVNGATRIVDRKLVMAFSAETWIRCILILNYDTIKFAIQDEKVRAIKTVFLKELTDLNRGTIGFATNGNTNFYISAITSDEYNPNQKEPKGVVNLKKTRTFENFLKKTSERDIKAFCKKIYDKMDPNYAICTEPHTFCQLGCDNIVPRVENIINFKCYSQCVKSISIRLSPPNAQEKKKAVFNPKEADLIDYLLPGNESYRPAKVLQVFQQNKKHVLKVEYTSDDGDVKTNEVVFPSDDVKRCGSKLPARRDCVRSK